MQTKFIRDFVYNHLFFNYFGVLCVCVERGKILWKPPDAFEWDFVRENHFALNIFK